MSLLIVDDVPERLGALQTMLAGARLGAVCAAGSVPDAMRWLASGRIRLVLTDLMGPSFGGLELCRQMHGLPELADIPVVVLISETERAYLERIYGAGACDYIRRPLHLDETVARVQAILRSREEIARRHQREKELLAANVRLEAANRELERLAAVDPVTLVANRRSFNETMGRVWRSAARHSLEVSLLMVDLDFFKPYNDRLGHPAGDECLKCVAKALRAALLRPDDFLARYGGEEFAVILPRTGVEGACVVAERTRRHIHELGLLHPASPIARQVTISQGIACQVPQYGSSSGLLLQMADRALYKAKESGRNRVAIAGSVTGSGLSDFAAEQSHKRTPGSPTLFLSYP